MRPLRGVWLAAVAVLAQQGGEEPEAVFRVTTALVQVDAVVTDHAAVRDEATGKIGSASQFVLVPDLKKSRLALASVVLQDGEQPPGRSPYGGTTPAKRQFHRGAELEYLSVVEWGRKSGPRPDLTARIHLVRDGREIYAGTAKEAAVAAGVTAVTGKLKIGETMTPGYYYLGIVVEEHSAARTSMAEQWTDFEVVQ